MEIESLHFWLKSAVILEEVFFYLK